MRVFEIFQSINGEVTSQHQGSLCTFVRLAGCNLRCKWCDTVKAQDPESGYKMNIQKIYENLRDLGNPNITITGGEPLMQKEDLLALVNTLQHEWEESKVTIETNGSYELPLGWPVECWVVDYKLHSSGEMNKMWIWENNYRKLRKRDFIKFVIADEKDYKLAKDQIIYLRSRGVKSRFAFSSSSHHDILLSWMIIDKLFDVILNVQIHKLIRVP